MKILYTGRQVELAPAQLRKVEQRFEKVGKLLDGRDEREAHVVLALERHLHNAEITVNYHDHQLVGVGSDADLFTALNSGHRETRKAGSESSREMARHQTAATEGGRR